MNLTFLCKEPSFIFCIDSHTSISSILQSDREEAPTKSRSGQPIYYSGVSIEPIIGCRAPTPAQVTKKRPQPPQDAAAKKRKQPQSAHQKRPISKRRAAPRQQVVISSPTSSSDSEETLSVPIGSPQRQVRLLPQCLSSSALLQCFHSFFCSNRKTPKTALKERSNRPTPRQT